jgi:predicted O-linked N-acetylglucosamine transferase (SPINDLY family)
MDYRITDWHACPAGWERYHTERLVRLPNSQWCATRVGTNDGRDAAEHVVTFGALHNFSKVSPRVVALWGRLLREAPRARLILLAPGMAQLRQHVAAQFAGHGVDASRIEFRDRVPFEEYLALHGRIDVNLDAFPYSGGTTTCHSLWMGVPVVTLAGQTVVSRGGASALCAAGLRGLVAATEDQYVEIAAGLATDAPRLARLRSGLRDRVASSPLADAARFTRDLEAAYRAMWEDWCRRR